MRFPNRSIAVLGGGAPGGLDQQNVQYLEEFRLEAVLPVWRFEIEGVVVETGAPALPPEHRPRHLPLAGRRGPVRLTLRPSVTSGLTGAGGHTARGSLRHHRRERTLRDFASPVLPAPWMLLHGTGAAFTIDSRPFPQHPLSRRGRPGVRSWGYGAPATSAPTSTATTTSRSSPPPSPGSTCRRSVPRRHWAPTVNAGRA